MCLLIKRASPHEAGGEGDPTVSHAGRDAVCPEARGRICGFPTLSFYDLVRSMGCFSQTSCIAPFLPLTTPPFVLFLIYMDFESVNLFLSSVFFFFS